MKKDAFSPSLLLWHAVSANLEHVENAKRKKTLDIASGTLTPPPGPACRSCERKESHSL